SNASAYSFDEFLISLRAYSPAEIMALANSPRAGDGEFLSGVPSQCGSVSLHGNGQRPVLGNGTYGMVLQTNASGPWSVNLGFSRCTLGGSMQLPLDAGALTPLAQGCWLLADSLASVDGIAAGGPVQIPFPIPASPTLAGLELYAQGLLIDFTTPPGQIEASNGLAIAIGN